MLVLGLAVAAGGCSSGGGGTQSVTATALALRSCGIAGIYNIFSLIERMGLVIDELQGTDVPGLSVTPTGVANQWDFSIALDLNVDGISDSTVTGRVTFAQNPTDGIEPGDTATLTVSQPGAPDLPALNGTFNLQFLSASNVSLTGTGAVNGVEGCNVTFTLPASDPLVLEFAPGVAPSTLAFNLANAVLAMGTVNLTARSGANTYVATVVFDVSNDIQIIGPTLNNAPLPDVVLPNVLGENTFFAIQQCVFTNLRALIDAADILQDVLQAIAASQSTIPGGTFTVTPVSSLVFDLTAQVSDERDISLSCRVTRSGTNPDNGTATLTSLIVQSRASVPAGLDLTLPDFDATGGATITYAGGDLASVYGEIVTTTPGGFCGGGLEIPSTNPLAVSPSQPTRLEFDLVADGVPFKATFILVGGASPSGVLVYGARIGGTPVPGNLLEGLLDIED
jgi:hypothetical protein